MPTEPATLPRCEIRHLSDEEGGGYLVEFPDYPGYIADGETPEEAVLEGRDALTSYLETLKALGRPARTAGAAFGGQWRQRVPKSLHAALARRAASEGVSLNLLVTTMLAEGSGSSVGLEDGLIDAQSIAVARAGMTPALGRLLHHDRLGVGVFGEALRAALHAQARMLVAAE